MQNARTKIEEYESTKTQKRKVTTIHICLCFKQCEHATTEKEEKGKMTKHPPHIMDFPQAILNSKPVEIQS